MKDMTPGRQMATLQNQADDLGPRPYRMPNKSKFQSLNLDNARTVQRNERNES